MSHGYISVESLKLHILEVTFDDILNFLMLSDVPECYVVVCSL